MRSWELAPGELQIQKAVTRPDRPSFLHFEQEVRNGKHSLYLPSIDVFELWCWWRVPWAARRSNQSILKEFNPEYSLEGWAEVEAPILLPHDANSRLVGKDPDAGKDWRQEKKIFPITNGTYHIAQRTLLSDLWWPKWEGNPKKRGSKNGPKN